MTTKSFEPNFSEVFEPPLGRPPRHRSFTAGQVDRLARKKLTDFRVGCKMCCRGNCARRFLDNTDNLEKCLRWRRAWYLVPQRSQNIVILGYVRANSAASSISSSARQCSMDQNQQPDHVAPDCEQISLRPEYFQDIDDRTQRIMKTAYRFLGITVCRRGWLFLTGISSSVLVRARRQTGRGETDWVHKGFNRLRVQMTAMAALLWTIVQNLQETVPLKDVPFDHVIMPFHEKVFLFRMMQDNIIIFSVLYSKL